MKRNWHVWLYLFACATVVAAAMAWLTVHALRADRERQSARAEADLEQRVSLALWRMDTKLAPLIAQEAARPHFFYQPFLAVNTANAKTPGGAGDIPSPMLSGSAPNVLLNFQCPTGGNWSSPQAPPEPMWDAACSIGGATRAGIEKYRAKLDEFAASVDAATLLEQLPQQPLPQIAWDAPQLDDDDSRQDARANAESPASANGSEQQAQGRFYVDPFGNGSTAPNAEAPLPNEAPDKVKSAVSGQAAQAQQAKGAKQQAVERDLTSRNRRYQSLTQEELLKQRVGNAGWVQNGGLAWGTPAIENISRPLWMDDRLVLARRVERNGQTVVQGSWLDWPAIKADLLAETADLLPQADLAPVSAEADAEPTRMLAGLPVRLVVAPATLAAGAGGPLHWALGIGWAAMALALAAVAALLWGVLALSERRAAFVSSVTHELRTPLTTFRLYADMLVRDMAPTPERRREYLQTLSTEAERLTHLVENVLSYARLERGRRPNLVERTTPAALIERLAPRLAERVEQSGMTLETTIDSSVSKAELTTDVGAVEQIVFNLVDNAAKYAQPAADRRIHVEASCDGRWASIAVRDHGPGFASVRAASRMAPFSKSAQQAAESAPGVGLGLALCRRLARELGGRLDLGGDSSTGARATLRLPIGGVTR